MRIDEAAADDPADVRQGPGRIEQQLMQVGPLERARRRRAFDRRGERHGEQRLAAAPMADRQRLGPNRGAAQGEAEIERNSRARSSVLRHATRTAVPAREAA